MYLFKTILILLLTALLGLFSFMPGKQELLKPIASGFELEGVSWWIQHKDYWTVTTENASEGDYSLKYMCDDFSAVTSNVQVHTHKLNHIKLNKGLYLFKLKVWVSNVAPWGFSTNINSNGDSPFVPVVWQFDGVERNKWVLLSQMINLKHKVNSGITISVNGNPNYGGEGTFYIDEFEILKQ